MTTKLLKAKSILLNILLLMAVIGAVYVGVDAYQSAPPQNNVNTYQVQVTLQNPPVKVPNAQATVVGSPGPCVYYYWIVTDGVNGNSSPFGPVPVYKAICTLSGSNYNNVAWGLAGQGLTYDVLRTSTVTAPVGACNCAVATAVSGQSQTDQSNSLSSYTVNSYNAGAADNFMTNPNGQLAYATGSGQPVPITQIVVKANPAGLACNTNQIAVGTGESLYLCPASGSGSGTFVAANYSAGSGSFANITVSGLITAGSAGIGNVGLHQTIETSGTGTFTIPANITYLKVTVVGGGGGGAGCASGTNESAPGGGGGGTAIAWLSGLTPGNTLSYSVGPGGAGGATGANAGTGGTASTVSSGTQTISTITGGAGGGAGTSGAGGIGGTASGGNINLAGGGGGYGFGTTTGFQGPGGAGGGTSLAPFSVAFGNGIGSGGIAPANSGAGGGGGANNGTAEPGGTGGSGIVIFEWLN